MKKKQKTPKRYIMYDAIYSTILKFQNYRNDEQIIHCQGLGGRGREVVVIMKTWHEESCCQRK